VYVCIAGISHSQVVSESSFLEVGLQELVAISRERWVSEMGERLAETLYKHKPALLERFHAMDDEDGRRDGSFTVVQFREGLKAVCESITLDQMDRVIALADPENSGWIRYQEFLSRFQTLFAASLRHELGPNCDDRVVQRVCQVMHSQKDSLRVVFENIDQSGDECISIDEFKLAVGELGLDWVDTETSNAIFTLMDVNHDGEVEYNEFIEAFKVVDIQNVGGQSMGVKSKKKKMQKKNSEAPH